MKPFEIPVSVPAEDLSHFALVGAGLLSRLGQEIKRNHPYASRVALVSDDNVMPLYGKQARETLEAAGLDVIAIEIPHGEKSKSPAQLLKLIEHYLRSGLSRKDVIVSLGGGVICDLAGLSASLFMRGIGLVHCPTSLLAQVDASVGGKVAVDLHGETLSAKNVLGNFYFPSVVIADTSLLKSLPDEEIASGLGEMIKHAALFSEEHFDHLVDAADGIYARDSELLAKLVATSMNYKARCVSKDPMEHHRRGKGRIVLNLGHTVGHAIESMSNYEVGHGQAVGLGLIAAARISERKKLCAPGLEDRMSKALSALRLPTDLDRWCHSSHSKAMEQALGLDKKRMCASIAYVGLSKLGESSILELKPPEIVALLRSS